MASVHSPVGHWVLRLLVDICEVSVHRLFCPSGAGYSVKPTQCISLPVSVSSPSCWCLAPELCPATSCLCPALTSGVKLTHPGDAFGQIMLLCTRHWPHPWCRFCTKNGFSSGAKQPGAARFCSPSVFQLRPAKDNASSQLPTLHLISLVLKLQQHWFYLFILWSLKYPSIPVSAAIST